MMWRAKIGGLALLLSALASLMYANPLAAQDVQLNQEIKPLECTYTTTTTGSGSVMTSTCPNEPVPMVTSVDVNGGRPIVTGFFKRAETKMLRVWVWGQWYTLGSDAHLSASGDMWRLDLSSIDPPFPPGDYVVTVDVEASDGLLIRNTYAWFFTVQPQPGGNTHSSQPPSIIQAPHTLELAPLDVSVAPPLQSGAVNRPIVHSNSKSPSIVDRSETNAGGSLSMALVAAAVAAVIVGLAIVQVLAMLRKPKL